MKLFTLVQKAENKTHEEPIVLVHGSWGASWMWNMHIPFLNEKGWDVYALDLRGHGQGEGELAGATMQDYVDDVRQIVEENNLENPIVIGHSMGGLVALMYGAQFGALSVISIDGLTSRKLEEGKQKFINYALI